VSEPGTATDGEWSEILTTHLNAATVNDKLKSNVISDNDKHSTCIRMDII